MKVYRIVKPIYARTELAFSGEGGLFFPGRWHSRGRRIVYTSGSLSLAILEAMVHVPSPKTLQSYQWFTAEIPDELIERPTLPAGWDTRPPGVSMEFGAEWLRAGRSVAMAVISVLAPESNYLINPGHRDFGRIGIEGPFELQWDRRLE